MSAWCSGIQLGILQACLDTVLPYMRERKQFGAPIGGFQLMQSKVADMVVALNSSRAYVYAMARTYDTGRRSNISMREPRPNSSESRNPRVVTSATRAPSISSTVLMTNRGAVTEQRRLAKIDPDLVDARDGPVERAGMCSQRLIYDPPRPRVTGRKVRECPYIHSDMYRRTLSEAFSSCFSNGIEIY
jgi:hypothetical protein